MFALGKCALILCAAVAASSAFELGDMGVQYHYYSRNNPTISHPLQPTPNSIMQSPFLPNLPTYFTIHNNGEGVSGNFNAFVIPALLGAQDVNIIAIDWSQGSSMYTQGLGNAVECGERIALFINLLNSNFGYSPNLVRLIGVGLGAHIAGIAADMTNGEIPHIIALDPSLHGWTHHPYKLNPAQAGTVEVLHTTAGLLGYDDPMGDLDFYPNGGSMQNGCGTDVLCSHIYSYAFFAESVSPTGGRFVGTACDNYEQAVNLQCSGPRDVVFGGLEDKTGQSGIYSFGTNFSPPFAQG